MTPTYEVELLAECIAESGGVLTVTRTLPPDGLEVLDLLGNVYVCMVYKQSADQERDVP